MQSVSRPALRRLIRSHTRRPNVSRIVPAALTSLLLISCRDPKVTSYSVQKDASESAQSPAQASGMAQAPSPATSTSTAPAPAAMPGGADIQTASGPGLTWTAPTDWSSKSAGMMRKATYAIAGPDGRSADLAILAFPGDVGGEVANINRWRGQAGLPPLPEAEAAASAIRIESNGLSIVVVDAQGSVQAGGAHLLGAMVPYGGATWFFKLLGPDSVVAKAKPEFMAFLKTIKPAGAAAP